VASTRSPPRRDTWHAGWGGFGVSITAAKCGPAAPPAQHPSRPGSRRPACNSEQVRAGRPEAPERTEAPACSNPAAQRVDLRRLGWRRSESPLCCSGSGLHTSARSNPAEDRRPAEAACSMKPSPGQVGIVAWDEVSVRWEFSIRALDVKKTDHEAEPSRYSPGTSPYFICIFIRIASRRFCSSECCRASRLRCCMNCCSFRRRVSS
jgi:hypothetical protein